MNHRTVKVSIIKAAEHNAAGSDIYWYKLQNNHKMTSTCMAPGYENIKDSSLSKYCSKNQIMRDKSKTISQNYIYICQYLLSKLQIWQYFSRYLTLKSV